MSKVLLTGGAGFIGYFLLKRLLRDGADVTLVDNLSRGRMDEELGALVEHERVTFIQGDMTDPRLYMKLGYDFDYIYHFAAVIGVKNVLERPDKVLYTNAIANLHLFEYAKQLPSLKRILFASTSEIYAGTLKHYELPLPTPEDVPLCLADIQSPRTTYALSKMYGESIAFNYSHVHQIPVTNVRYHNVFGPRMGFLHVIPEMFIKIQKQDVVEVASPTHTRAFCYIDDAVEATIRCCEAEGTKGESVNIGNSDLEISILELVSVIAEVLGRDVRFEKLPDTPGSPARRCPDTTKLKTLTGFQAEVGLKEAISKTYDWYKDKLDSRYE